MKVIDLTHSVCPESPNWEGVRPTLHSVLLATHQDDGYYARHVAFDEHSATHIDAPAHMCDTGITVDRIPPDQLVRPLVLINVQKEVAQDDNYGISLQDLANWESKHGEIPRGAVVVANTGWSKRWPSMDQYRNINAEGVMHFPGFSFEAARWLVDVRHIAGLGTDTLSVDRGIEAEYPVHRYCAPRGLYNLESVANLDQVPAAGAMIVVAPLKLEAGSGAPVRLLALIND